MASTDAPLPSPCGPLSGALIELLPLAPGTAEAVAGLNRLELAAEAALPEAEGLGGDDLHLALYVAYELHYTSFAGADPRWEWEPGLLAVRSEAERVFLGSLRRLMGPPPEVEPEELGSALFALAADDDGPPLSLHIDRRATLEQFREFVIHRSAYQLKEADPHSWAIPRIVGAAKAALLEVQTDEYGGGRADRMHSALFAKTMRALGLDDRPGAYVGRLPGSTLATVNLMSACGLRRELRGAIVGHLAMFEMTSSIPNRRYGNAMRRLRFGADATDFYDEHVEADAVHENIAAYDLAQGLARAEPELTGDILFGAMALLELEGRFAARLLQSWEAGRSSLREPGTAAWSHRGAIAAPA
jgi:hypothetical protein